MSTSSTPNESAASQPATPKKERRAINALIDLLRSSNRDGNDSISTGELVRLLLESGDLTPAKRQKIAPISLQASSFKDVRDVTVILGLEYDELPQFLWEAPVGSSHFKPSPNLESSYIEMRNAPYRHQWSCDPMVRTLIDLVVFDVLKANQNAQSPSGLCMRGEYPITTQLPNSAGVITGEADYVLGYNPQDNSLEYDARTHNVQRRFESISVIMEAKNNTQMKGDALAQAVTYMVGVQQKRQQRCPGLLIDTTYGVVSDAKNWCFLRLNRNVLSISRSFYMASVLLSPHTTPERPFPLTREMWENNIEAQVFGTPTRQPGQSHDGAHEDLHGDVQLTAHSSHGE